MEKQEPIIELVLCKVNKGIKSEESQEALKELNNLLLTQEEFIYQKTAMAADGQFLDLGYWKNLKSAEKVSKEIMKNEKALAIFNVIDNKTRTFNPFKSFNNFNN